MKRPGQFRARRSPLSRSGPPKRNTPIRKQSKKRPAEITRTMGTPARRRFVASLPCAMCGVVGYSQNAHVLGNAGKGKKKDCTTIAPLCGPRPGYFTDSLDRGCHALFDEQHWLVPLTFDPERAAAETEAAWQFHLRLTGRARQETE